MEVHENHCLRMKRVGWGQKERKAKKEVMKQIKLKENE